MNFTAIIIGFVFGAILQYASLNRFNVISGMATLEDFTIAKALALAIGLGAILISIEVTLGLGSFHIKPIIVGGLAMGGLIFGAGMAILGYCPGTLAISLGEGSADALVGIIGALAGGLVYSLVYPSILGITGPNLGSISLYTLLGSNKLVFLLITFVVGAGLIWIAFLLQKQDSSTSKKWIYSGIALAILNTTLNLTSVINHPLGASSAYPVLAALSTGTVDNNYISKIKEPGIWEIQMLAGAFLAGLLISAFKKEFHLTFIHSRWEKYKGSSSLKRVTWAFAGGFLLLFGARMAGGCTSGHILSGGMQMSASSMIFAVFVFGGLLSTGRFFYGRTMHKF
jgi:uncharacterized protein